MNEYRNRPNAFASPCNRISSSATFCGFKQLWGGFLQIFSGLFGKYKSAVLNLFVFRATSFRPQAPRKKRQLLIVDYFMTRDKSSLWQKTQKDHGRSEDINTMTVFEIFGSIL